MEIQHTTLLIIGGGPGGYVAAIRAAQLSVPPHPGGRRHPGRHLPQHWLHPVQSPDPRGRGLPPGAPLHGRQRAGHSRAVSQHRRDKNRALEKTASWPGSPAASALLKKHGVRVIKRLGADRGRQNRGRDSQCARRTTPAHPGRAPAAGHRLDRTGAARHAVLAGASSRPPRRCHPPRFRKNWWWWAVATLAWSWARCTASSAPT